jgi:hypothetical protein
MQKIFTVEIKALVENLLLLIYESDSVNILLIRHNFNSQSQ